VNKKQCPKCGEENPPEAVMCWACYTPLSGGGAVGGASAAGGGGATAATTHDDGEKKKIPPWQLGVIGVGLLLAIGIGVRSMMPASSSDEGAGIDAPAGVDPAMPPSPGGGGEAAPAPSPSPSGGGSSITPEEAPYKIVVPPNPRVATATMAIVPTDGNVSGSQAASYAAAVRRQFGGQIKRWKVIYIYVFSDEKTAAAFADFMRQRRGAPLSSGDYASLSSLWGSTLARYEYSPGSGRERALYPSRSPSNWWYGNN
jgi:hypothetical protein